MEIAVEGIFIPSIRFTLSWQTLILITSHDTYLKKKKKNLSTKLEFCSFFSIFSHSAKINWRLIDTFYHFRLVTRSSLVALNH